MRLQPARRRSAGGRDDAVEADRVAVRQQQPIARADRLTVVQVHPDATHPVGDSPLRARPVTGENILTRCHETDLTIDSLPLERVPHGQCDFDASRAGTDHGERYPGRSRADIKDRRPALEETGDRAQGQQPLTECPGP